LAEDPRDQAADVAPERIEDHFHLLQACDNLSLLTCVDYAGDANLLHALPVTGHGHEPFIVQHIDVRHFRLDPYPLDDSPLTFEFPARLIQPLLFTSAKELRDKFNAAEVHKLSVTIETGTTGR
jgi:hypothetical protein